MQQGEDASDGGPRLIYRPDIDGLRAISVLAVVLYHYGLGPFPGGFVGVDVFFVISGFLITSIIYSDIQKGRFSLARYYERRFRRILPALVAVLITFLGLGYALLLPTDFQNLGVQSAFAAFGISNFFFWEHSEYFDVASEQQPMLHTWSLGVEEQFYIVWPLMLVAILRLARSGGRLASVITLALLILGSFSLSVYQVAAQPVSAFYLLPSRAWELALGAILVFAPPLAGAAAHVAPGVGLALIAYAVGFLNSDLPFPGSNALFPCIGAALVIWPRSTKSITALPLHFPPMIWIGLISYSLYLWHWPVLVIYRLMGIGKPLSTTELWSLAGLAFVLSIVSYIVVERPFRRGKAKRWAVIAVGLMSMTVTGAAGVVVWTREGMIERYSPQSQFYLRLLSMTDIAQGADQRCFVNSTERIDNFDVDFCLPQSADKPNVLLIGESFAAQYQKPLQTVFPEISLSVATASGCHPVLPLKGLANCVNFHQFVLENVIKKFRYDAIILSANWRRHSLVKLPETLRTLKEHAGQVIVFGPSQIYSAWLPGLLVKSETLGDGGAIVRRASRLTVQRRIEVEAKKLMTEDGEFFSILDTICPQPGDECMLLTEGGVPVNIDYGHFSVPAAEMVLSRLRQKGLLSPAIAHVGAPHER